MSMTWKAAIAAVVASVVTACATDGQAPAATQPASVTLRNADFEAEPVAGACPPQWACAAHNSVGAFKFEVASEPRPNGRFLKVTRVKDEPWALVTQAIQVEKFGGRRVKLSASVLAPKLQGEAGPMIIVQSGTGIIIASRKGLVKAGEGWQRATVELEMPPAAAVVELGVVMEGGGWVGFDDVVVSVE